VTSDELIAGFFKTVADPEGTDLFVCKITWDGPFTAVNNWIKVASFPPDADPALIHKATMQTLRLKRYFKYCAVCHERKPSGWIYGTTCHACMEKDGALL
jgi:hypothetical protein